MLNRAKFAIPLTLCLLITFSLISTATDQTKPIFNESAMRYLQAHGYKWHDLTSASILAHDFHLPLDTILKLRPTGTSWSRVRESLEELDNIRQILHNEEALSQHPIILSLVKRNFTEKEIAILSYTATLNGISLAQQVTKEMEERGEGQGKKIPDYYPDLSFEVSPEYIATATSITEADDPGYGYDVAKCAPYSTFVGNITESISPATGFLTLTETDLALPGKTAWISN